MTRNPFGLPEIKPVNVWGAAPKKRRKKLTPAQRIYIWEHPEKYGRTCNICHGRIQKLSDLELDHTRAVSKGGTRLALAHKECNRMKGSKSLRQVQERMRFKVAKTKRRTRTKRKTHASFDVKSIKLPTFKFKSVRF